MHSARELYVPAPVQQILALYKERLAQVTFPDVSAEILEQLSAELERAEQQVAELRATLSEAERAADEARETLLARASRAVAYARVYGDDDPGLLAELELIQLPRVTRRPVAGDDVGPGASADAAPRRRGRPPKAKDANTMPLTLEENGTAAQSAS
jgi:hypothetical protein